MKQKVIGVRIDERTFAALKRIADADKRSLSGYVRLMIQQLVYPASHRAFKQTTAKDQ